MMSIIATVAVKVLTQSWLMLQCFSVNRIVKIIWTDEEKL